MPAGGARGFHLDAGLAVAHLTLERSPANVLDIRELDSLSSALRRLPADTRVLVISGSPHFTAGVAIQDHAPEKTDAMLAAIHGFLSMLLAADAVTVAAVEGACLGGGAEIALCCDLVVAAEDARIGFPEITLACFPPVGALLLPFAIGPARALELLLSGRAISGREAERLGMVSRVANSGEAAARAEEFASEIAGRSRPAVAGLLALVRGPKRRAFAERRAEAEDAYRVLLEHADLKRSVEGFLARKGG
jgi:cyclohexa-1,5-dienecarbonyl-CoA hydratase